MWGGSKLFQDFSRCCYLAPKRVEDGWVLKVGAKNRLEALVHVCMTVLSGPGRLTWLLDLFIVLSMLC